MKQLLEKVEFNPRIEFDCITSLFEQSGVELKLIGNGIYEATNHNSLRVRAANCPKNPNTFYWNSIEIGGGFRKAKEALKSQGYTLGTSFIPKKQDHEFEVKNSFSIAEKANYRLENSKGILTSNFHVFCRKLGIKDSFLKKCYIGTYKSKSFLNAKQTVFNKFDINGNFLGVKLIDFQENGKRNKTNQFSIQKYDIEAGCYGEHLIRGDKKIIIPEAEKTASLGRYYMPQYDWIAVGGANGRLDFEATYKRIKEKYPNFKDSDFIYLIDYDFAGLHSDISKNLGFQIQKFVVKNSPNKGYDLADYLVDGHNSKKPFSLDLSVITEKLGYYHTQRILQFEGKEFDLSVPKIVKASRFLSNDKNFIAMLKAKWFESKKLFLQADTGRGKSFLIRNVIIPDLLKKGKRVIYAAPNLSNTKSFGDEFKDSDIDKDYFVAIQASETGDYSGNSDLQRANLILTTFEGLKKLDYELDIFNDPNTVFIVDEIHKTDYLDSKIFYKFKKCKNQCLFVSATLPSGLISVMDCEKLTVEPLQLDRKVKFYDSENVFEACIDYALNFDFTTKKAFFGIQTVSEIDYLTSILLQNGVLKDSEILRITSENKKEWSEILATKKVPNHIKAVFATTSFEVGNDLYNTDFAEVVLCDSKQYPINPEYSVQMPNRFRSDIKPDVLIFRKSNTNTFDYESRYKANLGLANLHLAAVNLGVKQEASFALSTAAKKNDFDLSSLNKMILGNDIDYKNLYQYTQETHNKSLSNENFANEMLQYGSFIFEFEKYEFVQKEAVASDLKDLRIERKASIDLNLMFQKEVLTVANSLETYETKILELKDTTHQATEPSQIPKEILPIFEHHAKSKDFDTAKEKVLKYLGGATIKKRVETFEILGNDFEAAKNLVLDNFAEVKFANEKIRQTAKYLLNTDANRLTQKQRFTRKLIEAFKAKIDHNTNYTARQLNDLFVSTHAELIGLNRPTKNKLFDRYGSLIYQTFDIPKPPQKTIPKGAYTKTELLAIGINPKKDLKGTKYEYKQVKQNGKVLKKYFIE